jgi:hypothetical protein
MPRQTLYKQCELTRPVEDGLAREVAWIPEKFAVPGRYVKLDRMPEAIRDGWRVENATGPAVEEHVLVQQSHRSGSWWEKEGK